MTNLACKHCAAVVDRNDMLHHMIDEHNDPFAAVILNHMNELRGVVGRFTIDDLYDETFVERKMKKLQEEGHF